MEQELNITLSKEEALVLFAFLSRVNPLEHNGLFEDQAEQKVLWTIEALLEKQLVEPFMPDYRSIIENARNHIRDKA